MQFIDPMVVECPNCGSSQAHSVRKLLALSAQCRSCGYRLEETGREMQHAAREWTAFLGITETALELEEKFGITLSDVELSSVDKIEELALLIDRKSPNHHVSSETISETLACLLDDAEEVTPSDLQPSSSIRELFSRYAKYHA